MAFVEVTPSRRARSLTEVELALGDVGGVDWRGVAGERGQVRRLAADAGAGVEEALAGARRDQARHGLRGHVLRRHAALDERARAARRRRRRRRGRPRAPSATASASPRRARRRAARMASSRVVRKRVGAQPQRRRRVQRQQEALGLLAAEARDRVAHEPIGRRGAHAERGDSLRRAAAARRRERARATARWRSCRASARATRLMASTASSTAACAGTRKNRI